MYGEQNGEQTLTLWLSPSFLLGVNLYPESVIVLLNHAIVMSHM